MHKAIKKNCLRCGFGIVIFVAGCTVGPDYSKPKLELAGCNQADAWTRWSLECVGLAHRANHDYLSSLSAAVSDGSKYPPPPPNTA